MFYTTLYYVRLGLYLSALVVILMIVTSFQSMFFPHTIIQPNPTHPNPVQPAYNSPNPITVTPNSAAGNSAYSQPQPMASSQFQVPTGALNQNPVVAPVDPAIRSELYDASKSLTHAALQTERALEQIAVWNRDIQPLRTNPIGQAIAVNNSLLKEIAFLFNEQRPSSQELTQTRERIRTLQEETDRRFKDVIPSRLTPEMNLEVRDVYNKANDAQLVWSKAVEQANAIVRESKQQPMAEVISPTPSQPNAVTTSAMPSQPVAVAPTPSQAVAVDASSTPSQPDPTSVALSTSTVGGSGATSPPKVDILVPVIEGVADASNVASAAKPKATEQLDSAITRFNDQVAREELARKIADEEKRKLEAEEKVRAKAESDRKEAEARAVLVKEARTEEVQRVLQPFLTPRRLQPRLAGSSVQMRTTLNEAPMSFSALQNIGALENTLNGLARLVRIGTHRDLSRPKWDYGTSSRTWSNETLNQLKHAQELLRRLGPTLVSEGLLSQ